MIAELTSPMLAFGFGAPGPMEILIIGGIAVLLFGNRLPSVARSVGRSFIEFKKGMRGIEDDVNDAVYHEPTKVEHYDSKTSAPRFEPPTEAPKGV